MPQRKNPSREVQEPEATLPATLGRPSSYRSEYTPFVAELCARGATDVELAQVLEVTQRTLNRWKVIHPEFAEALRRGKEPADERIVNSLYHKAQDREIEEEQAIKLKTVTYGDNGKRLKEEERVEVVTVKKFIPGDTTAMIFWLKNRRAQEWRDVHKHEHGKAGAFDHLDDKALDDYIEVGVQEITEITALPPPPPKTDKRRKSEAQH